MIIFLIFLLKPYVVTPHLNRLNETVQMRGHNIRFYAELTKIIPNYHQILPLIKSSEIFEFLIVSQDLDEVAHCEPPCLDLTIFFLFGALSAKLA